MLTTLDDADHADVENDALLVHNDVAGAEDDEAREGRKSF